MSEKLGAIVMFDENLYRPGHLVNRWMHGLVLHFETHAKHYAPKRSGELAAMITSEAHEAGTRKMAGSIASNADHTWYVLEGTKSPIMSSMAWWGGGNIADAYMLDSQTGKWGGRPGYWLAVGKERLHPPIIYRHSVTGQKANNFMFRAWRRTAWNHRSIRGLTPQIERF